MARGWTGSFMLALRESVFRASSERRLEQACYYCVMAEQLDRATGRNVTPIGLLLSVPSQSLSMANPRETGNANLRRPTWHG